MKGDLGGGMGNEGRARGGGARLGVKGEGVGERGKG